MKAGEWFRRQTAALSLALVNVEKNALGQQTEALSTNTTQHRKVQETNLLQALQKGEINQEVKELRWRTYKILQATSGMISEITGYDEEGNPITKTKKVDRSYGLRKIKLDTYDTYPLQLSYDTTVVTSSISEAMDRMTHLNTQTEFFAGNKPESPIEIQRESLPKFAIEDYTKKLNVRTIDDKTRMLEFYVSKYPDTDNRTTRLFISEIKKIMDNPRSSNIVLIDEVSFTSLKTIGVDDFLNFHYKIHKFDKVVEFNGFYVLKFIAEVLINGENILETYKEENLDKRYANKEPRKHNI